MLQPQSSMCRSLLMCSQQLLRLWIAKDCCYLWVKQYLLTQLRAQLSIGDHSCSQSKLRLRCRKSIKYTKSHLVKYVSVMWMLELSLAKILHRGIHRVERYLKLKQMESLRDFALRSKNRPMLDHSWLARQWFWWLVAQKCQLWYMIEFQWFQLSWPLAGQDCHILKADFEAKIGCLRWITNILK